MIIVKIWGGIGNQLFQYVLGQYLHYCYHQEVKYDDNSFVSTDKLRKRELDAIDSVITWDNHCSFSKYRGIKGRFLRYCYQLLPKHHYIGINEKIPKRLYDNNEYFFQAYWQDYKYYKWLIDNVPSFKVRSKNFPKELNEIKTMIESCPQSASIHIRRGDYFSPENVSVYGVCTEDYYHKAISLIKNKESKVRFFVFTDDIEWVKENIQLDDNMFIVPNYDISQFAYIELMSLCRHHIISNSSFSWWGAVLNEQNGAMVICPSKWTLTSDKTIALKKWMKL